MGLFDIFKNQFEIKNGVLVKYKGKDSNVVIPDSVTSIGNRAFDDCTSLTSVTIPNSVTSIGKGICARCTQLKQISVEEGNDKYISIDGNLYTKDGKTLVQYAIGKKDTSFNIPSSVTSIGDIAFHYCTSLQSISIPNSVTSIGEGAFIGCTSLQSITIPDSVTSIGNSAFWYCVSLKSITIPDSVTSIGNYAFAWCENLKTVYNLSKLNIQKGAETHGKVAYYADNVYTELPKTQSSSTATTPTTTQTKATSTTQPTQKVAEPVNPDFEIEDGVLVNYKGNGGNVVIPKSVISIGDSAFDDCTSLKSITIPSSVTSIGDWAFCDCASLANVNYLGTIEGWCGIDFEGDESNPLSNGAKLYLDGKLVTDIVIPKTIKKLNETVFLGCSSITSVVISNSVRSIGESAFYGCTSLASITIPSSVTSIGDWAFCDCASLANVNYLGTIEGWCGIDFEGDESNPLSNGAKLYLDGKLVTDIVIPKTIKKLNETVFLGCSSITSVVISNSVRSIGESAFYGCTSLASITIPSSVTSIGDWAFCDCASLANVNYLGTIEGWCGIDFEGDESNPLSNGAKLYLDGKLVTDIVIPKTIKKLNDYVFFGCSSITNVVIPNSVTSIGVYAFSNCSSLANIEIPNSVENIGEGAFAFNESLMVYVKNDIGYIGNDANPYLVALCVMDKNKTDLSIAENCKVIYEEVYSGCDSISSITIPSTVISIGEGTECQPFSFLTSLKQINVADNNPKYKSIEGNLYSKDGKTLIQYAIGKKNTSFIIPNLVTSIGVGAFGCSSLTSITIPDSVTSIDRSAFFGCGSLKDLIIPNTVTSISNNAFQECKSLVNITIPNSVTSIGNYAFYDCENLKTVCNLSTLDIQKGSYTNGYVAYYADNVYTEPPKSIEQSKQSKIDKVDTQASDMSGNIPKDLVDKNKTKIVSTPDFVVNADGVLIEYKGSAENIVIPNTVIGIGANVFENTAITSLKCGDNLYFIDGFAFNDCSSLKTIELGNGLRCVGDYAFALCTSLTTIMLPVSLVRIGTGAFEGCDSIKKVYNQSALGIEKKSKGHGNVAENATIVYEQNKYLESFTITDGTVVAYEGGKDYRVIALPSTVKSIGSEAFADNDTLEEIHTPDSLVEIGYRAFENCSKLTKVVLGSELERIAMHSFTKCDSLEDIVLPKTLKSIASWSFDDCTSLKEIVIPANVTAIEDGTFYGCTSLEKVTFLGEIQSIGAYAFDGCTSLKEINLPKDCNIDDTAFNNTTCKVKKQ